MGLVQTLVFDAARDWSVLLDSFFSVENLNLEFMQRVSDAGGAQENSNTRI